MNFRNTSAISFIYEPNKLRAKAKLDEYLTSKTVLAAYPIYERYWGEIKVAEREVKRYEEQKGFTNAATLNTRFKLDLLPALEDFKDWKHKILLIPNLEKFFFSGNYSNLKIVTDSMYKIHKKTKQCFVISVTDIELLKAIYDLRNESSYRGDITIEFPNYCEQFPLSQEDLDKVFNFDKYNIIEVPKELDKMFFEEMSGLLSVDNGSHLFRYTDYQSRKFILDEEAEYIDTEYDSKFLIRVNTSNDYKSLAEDIKTLLKTNVIPEEENEPIYGEFSKYIFAVETISELVNKLPSEDRKKFKLWRYNGETFNVITKEN